jgi:hypothetical protein
MVGDKTVQFQVIEKKPILFFYFLYIGKLEVQACLMAYGGTIS